MEYQELRSFHGQADVQENLKKGWSLYRKAIGDEEVFTDDQDFRGSFYKVWGPGEHKVSI